MPIAVKALAAAAIDSLRIRLTLKTSAGQAMHRGDNVVICKGGPLNV